MRLSIALALALGTAAWAQQTASIGGKLLDINGNPVLGTEGSVHLLNTATQKDASVAITSTGEYQLTGLAPGAYDLTVPMVCCMYGTFSQKGLALSAGQTLQLDLRLPWNINLGTIGDDPVMLMNDMRAKAKNIDGPTPRMPDGKVDFSGMWASIIDPRVPIQGGDIPLKPWAVDLQRKLFERVKGNVNALNPAAFCLPQSALQIALPFHFKLIQNASEIVHLTEFQTPGYRQIFLDGRGHPKDWNPAWVGHSTGSWDGNTLVVDSTGFNEETSGVGVHSEKLHVVERFQRPDKAHLRVDITIEDPEAYEKPWTRVVNATLVPQEEILEFVCAENNKDPLHFGGLGYAGGR